MIEMDDSINPLVSVVCTTYNHEAYIRQCLDGFIMQKTDFPFEIIVHDDASTDSTVSIIKEYEDKYPNLFNNIYRTENWFSQKKNIWGYLFTEKARGKYIALCEGDDYWTDPLKLQKQVDILEKNQKISLCCHAYQTLKMLNGNMILETSSLKERKDSSFVFGLDEFAQHWITKTLTLIFRNEFQYEGLKNYKYCRDVHLAYHLLCQGKGFYSSEIMGVYREHAGGIWSSVVESKRRETSYNLYKELFEKQHNKYTKKAFLVRTISYFNYTLFHLKSYRDLSLCFRLYWKALSLTTSIKDIKYLLAAFLSPWLKSKLK